jgi:signal peptidase
VRRTSIVGSALLCALALPLLVAMASVWGRGWTLANVRTGSMEPGIPPGSMVVLDPVDPADVEQGSVIAFRDSRVGGEVTTHRVLEVLHQAGGLFFRTQGDANPGPDGEPVPARAVVGEVRWRVRGLGALVEAIGRRSAQLALVGVPLGLLVGSELWGVRQRGAGKVIAALRAEVARLEGELARSAVLDRELHGELALLAADGSSSELHP